MWLRRLITIIPGVVIVAAGVDTTRALVLSQVVLSLAVPVPMLALVWFTSARAVMGDRANARALTAFALIAALVVVALNGILLGQVF